MTDFRKSGWRKTSQRRGYAMLTVLVFLALMMVTVAMNQRHLSSILRVEEQSQVAKDFHEGAGNAMARAMVLLETGIPPSDPYVCAVDIVTSFGTRKYKVTFTLTAPNTWTINIDPAPEGDSSPPMPPSFAS